MQLMDEMQFVAYPTKYAITSFYNSYNNNK